MTPVELSRTVLRAVRRAVEDGELRVAVPEKVSVTVPGAGGWGDYATNIALQLARPAGETPRRVAELLRPHLAGAQGVSGVQITGPGFLNISLGSTASTALVAEILRRGPRYGCVEADVEVEAAKDGISYDAPTDHPVHLHAPHDPRALVFMDATARLLRSQGTPVRTSCEARPDPEWTAAFRVEVDAYGTPATPVPLDVNVRPVPAPDLAGLLSLGPDAARWALLHPAAHDRPRPSADLLVQGEANPLFRVRYAYARTRAVSRNAADLGFTAQPGDVRDDVPEGVRDDGPADTASITAPPAHTPPPAPPTPPLLTHTPPPAPPTPPLLTHTPPPTPLLTHLADHPRLLARAAAHRAPDLLARHLVAVADAVLPLVSVVLPLGDEKPLAAHRARLALAEAAGAVLAGGLSLLGIDAPEHL
ncbi:ArgS-related anticodon-binding protein NrtL [Streptomyces sp. NPDC096013]|uniref:ArgS-related anticodon-binding protein NrtL n=1 Tax=Streptomyces sp. NPDC096013 TaxID=3366069 RepID=UPI0037F6FF69